MYKYGQDKPVGRLPNILGEARSTGEWLRNLKPTGVYHFFPASKLLIAVDPLMTKLHLIAVDPDNIPPVAAPEPVPPKKTTDPIPPKPKPTPKTPPKRPDPEPGPGASARPFRLAPLPEPLAMTPAEMKTAQFGTPSQLSPSRIQLAGGGRFILALRHMQKVDVFDLNEGKVVRQIEFPVQSTAWVTGLSKLFVFDRELKGLRRFDLLTGKEDKSITHSRQLIPLAIGNATNGPILCRETNRLRFVDGESLEPMDLDAPELTGPELANKTVWASPDGRTFGIAMGDMVAPGPAGFKTITLQVGPTGVRKQSGEFPCPYTLPDPSGRYTFVGGHGILDIALKKTTDVVRSEEPSPREPPTHFYLPAQSGPFYLRYHFTPPFGGPGLPPMGPPRAGAEAEISICAYGQLKPIVNLKVPDPLAGPPVNPMILSRLANHIHLIPSAKTLVVVPFVGDTLHFVPIDLAAEMTKSGIEVPWVVSSPPRTFKVGEMLSYSLKLNGKPDGVMFTLDNPPSGMNLAADGTLTWKAP